MVCLGTSTICHLLGCCSQHVVALVWRFDYVGIAALIVASFVPAVYYAFLCEPYLRAFYLLTTVAFGAGVVAVSLPDRFQVPEYRTLRAVVFSALGMWGVFPVGHQLLLHRGAWAVRTAFGLDALMGAIYLGGAAIYACRIPERWYPGRFDLVGHSHQLWHTAVVLAAYVHYRAVLVLLEWRDASGGCAAADLLGSGPPARLRAEFSAQGLAPVGSADEVWGELSARLAARYAEAHAVGVLPMP
jgi:adiponectin receptor